MHFYAHVINMTQTRPCYSLAKIAPVLNSVRVRAAVYEAGARSSTGSYAAGIVNAPIPRANLWN